MKPLYIAFLLPLLSFAAKVESPTGSRITPPTIASVSPRGVARGTTVEITVEGFNLAKTAAVYLSEAGIEAQVLRIKEVPDQPDVRLGSNGTASTIDLGPLPPRHQVTLELTIKSSVPVGPVDFRLLTPLGTTPTARFVVEPFFGEAPDREPNDTPEDAFEAFLPAIFAGTISKPGDVDYFKIQAEAGEEVSFYDSAPLLGSAMRPVVTILDVDQHTLHEFIEDRARPAFSYKFEKAGSYYVRIADYEEGGSANHTYRLLAGKLPVVLSAFPLGVERGKTADIALRGLNLGAASKISVKGEAADEDPDSVMVRPKTKAGVAFNRVRLALGSDPEIPASASPQPITLPVTVNGRLTAREQLFRFHARKDEKVVVEVNARRLGSPLDSLVEVLDANGKPIERATVRAVLETSLTLRDHDSVGRGLRLLSYAGLQPGDLMMTGSEIIRVETIPPNPDNDTVFEAFNNERITRLDTTAEAHAMDSPIYKVELAPPGSKFPPNGLPVVHLTYRNDDGGPGYSKDSLLHFTTPVDGDYLVRLTDVRGLSGEDFSYRLTVHHPEPSYRLAVSPRNPNVPAGGRIPLTITAIRMDGFDGPIPVSVKNLPPGLHATDATILPGDVRTTILLSADPDAKLASAAPLLLNDTHDKLSLISVIPRADVEMTAVTKAITLEPGGTADVEVAIRRNNGFGGRVPVEVRNLPPGVEVADTGLNGVLVNENETRRTFTLRMLPTAKPLSQPIYASGLVETRAGGQQNSFATEAIQLTIKGAAKGAQ